MQEKAITTAGKHHKLEEPFFVLATQNPIEQEGTYPLPEAQLDRFMFNVYLDYPKFEEELEVVRSTTSNRSVQLNKILHAAEIVYFQQLVRRVPVAENVLHYAVSLVSKTRPNTPLAGIMANEYLDYGAGPRASQFLLLGAKCHALIKGKFSPDIEDVKAVAKNVLRHRLIRNFKAEAEGISTEKIIESFL
jgi:MoxR-like ATPase